jgi:hypothetical protein
MIREDLEQIPVHGLPRHYKYHWYQPGDENLWIKIQSKADRFNEIDTVISSLARLV